MTETMTKAMAEQAWRASLGEIIIDPLCPADITDTVAEEIENTLKLADIHSSIARRVSTAYKQGDEQTARQGRVALSAMEAVILFLSPIPRTALLYINARYDVDGIRIDYNDIKELYANWYHTIYNLGR